MVPQVLSNLANPVDRALCLPWGREDRVARVDPFGLAHLQDLSVLAIPGLLVLKFQGAPGDLGDLQDQEVQLVLRHHLGQGHLLVLVIQVLQAFLAILACQVFLFLGNLEDPEALAFLETLAILDRVVPLGLVALVALVVLLVQRVLEFLGVPL